MRFNLRTSPVILAGILGASVACQDATTHPNQEFPASHSPNSEDIVRVSEEGQAQALTLTDDQKSRLADETADTDSVMVVRVPLIEDENGNLIVDPNATPEAMKVAEFDPENPEASFDNGTPVAAASDEGSGPDDELGDSTNSWYGGGFQYGQGYYGQAHSSTFVSKKAVVAHGGYGFYGPRHGWVVNNPYFPGSVRYPHTGIGFHNKCGGNFDYYNSGFVRYQYRRSAVFAHGYQPIWHTYRPTNVGLTCGGIYRQKRTAYFSYGRVTRGYGQGSFYAGGAYGGGVIAAQGPYGGFAVGSTQGIIGAHGYGHRQW